MDRAASNDLIHLAAEGGAAPANFGAVLFLDGPPDLAQLRSLLSHRIRAVPRLRRALRPTPFGCGRPVWVDDPAFDIAAHVVAISCPPPGDERALLDLAADLATRRLDPARPLWRLTLIRDLASGGAAIVIVLHHALADGIAGLAVLGALVDEAPPPAVVPFPAPSPTSWQLFEDALWSRLRLVRRVGAACRLLWRGRVLRQSAAIQAAPSSLNAPTGPERRLTVARADLARVRAVAHEHGGTVNDVLLTVVAGGVDRLLQSRGERLDSLVASIPASARTTTTPTALGNDVGVVVAALPLGQSDPRTRLDAVVAAARDAKQRAIPPQLITALNRVVMALGLAQRFVNRQHLVHTFVTNVHGPDITLTLAGRRITDALPITPTTGNVAVAFAAMSYGGTLVVTVTADPQLVPDLAVLTAALQAEFDALLTPRLAATGV